MKMVDMLITKVVPMERISGYSRGAFLVGKRFCIEVESAS